MKVAINLIAFMNTARQTEHLPLYVVLRDIVSKEVIQIDKKRPGHSALLVKPSVDLDRWEAIVAIIRLRFTRVEFPLYVRGSRGGWEKC